MRILLRARKWAGGDLVEGASRASIVRVPRATRESGYRVWRLFEF